MTDIYLACLFLTSNCAEILKCLHGKLIISFSSSLCALICCVPAELSSNGLPPGYLYHSHVGQEACLDYSFRGKHPDLNIYYAVEFIFP